MRTKGERPRAEVQARRDRAAFKGQSLTGGKHSTLEGSETRRRPKEGGKDEAGGEVTLVAVPAQPAGAARGTGAVLWALCPLFP